ncbi:Glycosyltransferase 2 [Gracilaria domingensis]|nr:Glycosyltransferase 2 [Gracilaria domingensis]
MDTLVQTYRSQAARAGSAEPFVHATVATYVLLLFAATILNIAAPHWVSRNVAPDPMLSNQSKITPLSTINRIDASSVSRCISRGLMLGIDDNPVVNRVRAEMGCGCRVPDVYEPHETPTVCAIIQSFNHEQNVERIAKSLVNNPSVQEIIICEDGSTDSSMDKWMEQLRDHKHFIVISNNLHETRCYNRAMRMSSAEYFVLLQDDDLAPESKDDDSKDAAPLNWVSHALELFDADPKLGVLSGFIGQLWDGEDKGFEFGEQTSDHGGTRKGKTVRIPFLSSRTLHPFMYVELGGLDVGLFLAGEPGVWQDCVLSYAAWNAGWRVGVYDSNFQRGVGGHGSASSPSKIKLRGDVWKKAKNAVDRRLS